MHQQQKELHGLREMVVSRDSELTELRQRQPYVVAGPTGFSSGAFYTVLFFAAVLAAVAGYLFFENKMNVADVSDKPQNEFVDTALQNRTAVNDPQQTTTEEPVVTLPQVKDTSPSTIVNEPTTDPMQFDTAAKNSDDADAQTQTNNSPTGTVQYTVKSRAYFHDEPVETTRRNAYMVTENNALLEPLDEKDGFVYVVYTNAAGQVSRGWLLKKDLEVKE